MKFLTVRCKIIYQDTKSDRLYIFAFVILLVILSMR